MGRLAIGTSGFGMARERYFQTFRAVEVQETFYRRVPLQTAERWRAAAPPGFVFTMKAWQLVTHPPESPTYRRLGFEVPPGERDRYGLFRPTLEVDRAWEGTEEFARALGAEVVLLQCPARFLPTDENIVNLDRFLVRRRDLPFRLAFEPRGPWPAHLVRRLCVRHALLHAVNPVPERPLSPGPRYFRLHGPQGYGSSHADAQLRAVLGLCGSPREAYVFFNNRMMAEDALRFAHLVEQG